ncbi:MAG: response regulator [Nannocystaceae bacterium]|nr:response regulator [Nannocystaceae bacterium]
MINLGVNARDAMPNGGNLWIRTGRDETAQGPRLRVSVRDEGEGIAVGDIERIFEPFFSTKNEHGTGLGLATVYGAVTQAGGTISVRNAEPQGALFEMSFPISSSVPKDAPASPPEESPSPAIVLVVEDEPLVRRTTARVLESAGYEVIAATSGEEALQLADTQKFDLVLSDVVMPGLSGVELSKRLHDINPQLPVVLMSGYSEDLDAFDGAHFIAKPFDTRGLRRIVREALNPDD